MLFWIDGHRLIAKIRGNLSIHIDPTTQTWRTSFFFVTFTVNAQSYPRM